MNRWVGRLVFALVLMLIPEGLWAQSWRGTINNVDLQIALRPKDGKTTFVVYANRASTALVCGEIEVATHLSLFCADDMSKYADAKALKVKAATLYNLLFSYGQTTYWCEASTPESPLYCRVRLSNQSDFLQDIRKLDTLRHN